MSAPSRAPGALIPVVGAVAQRGDRVFLARRPPGGRHGGLWEFPGGKVEPGERDEEALARELLEELDVPCEVGPLLAVGEDGVVQLRCYAVTLRGDPRPPAGQETAWWPLGALLTLDTPPADQPAIRALARGASAYSAEEAAPAAPNAKDSRH